MRKLFLPLLLAANLAQAQTVRYVSDQLEVPLRAGASERHKVVRMLSSGTPVEVVQTDAANGFALVRTDGGGQGWILSRYLMDTPSARQRLTELESVEAENARLKVMLDELAAAGGAGQPTLTALAEQNQQLRQELALLRKTADHVVAIDDQNRALHERVIDLERELQIVQQEKQALTERSRRDWFLLGAGVLLAGLVMGLIAPRLRPQKRSRWSEL